MKVTRRSIRFTLLAILALAAVSIDPNPRGPLAIAANLWLRGHDAESERWFERAAATLRAAGIDPAAVRLSLDIAPVGTEAQLPTLTTQLDRLARDDVAKSLYTALYLARTGDHHAARERLRALEATSAADRVRDLSRLLEGSR